MELTATNEGKFILYVVLPLCLISLSVLKCGFLKPAWKRAQRAVGSDNRAERLVREDSFELKLPASSAQNSSPPQQPKRDEESVVVKPNRTYIEHREVVEEERSAIKVQFKQKVINPKDPHLMNYNSAEPSSDKSLGAHESGSVAAPSKIDSQEAI
eukprot:TRINITY_DN3584_c0_g1_i1.p1 TRINITY_DN3584_c0_g1~~TRINITY_DN3584_c0_g1_i1.p1  ORF type:complete len:156 (-),score=41.12 TRINITY_DN3584_c0_g1_i1:589-1056(-)